MAAQLMGNTLARTSLGCASDEVLDGIIVREVDPSV